jgi:hypothetical protein
MTKVARVSTANQRCGDQGIARPRTKRIVVSRRSGGYAGPDMSGMRWTEYRGRGFYCRDGLLEVWLAVVVDELDRQGHLGASSLRSLRDDFHAQASVVFDGLMETRLDSHLPDDASRLELVALCQRLAARLRGGERPAGPLAIRIGGERWARGETIAGLTRITAAFLWLLDEPSVAVAR